MRRKNFDRCEGDEDCDVWFTEGVALCFKIESSKLGFCKFYCVPFGWPRSWRRVSETFLILERYGHVTSIRLGYCPKVIASFGKGTGKL